MPTERRILTNAWEQISDGNEEAAVQVMNGTVLLAESSGQPTNTVNAHSESSFVRIHPGYKIWACAYKERASIVITKPGS